MPEFDLVIKGGTVIDGLRTPRYRADVGIVGSRVARIGNIDSSDGKRVLDATGLNVAPGFVDLHTHYDSQIFWDPWCTISGYHGVTSVVIGNCGFGFAPCRPEHRDRAMLALERNEAVPLKTMQAGMPWDWETFPEYLDSLDRTPKGVNLLAYIGLTPIYAYVMGGIDAAKDGRPASEAELEEMCRILVDAMDAGACGSSTQMFGEGGIQRDYDGTPMVTDTRSLDELAVLARALGSTGRGFFQITSGHEATEVVARESKRPVIYNALTVTVGSVDQHGQPVRNMEDTMKFLDRVNAEGMRVYGQAVTARQAARFTLEDYNMFDNSPLWREATLGTPPERLAKLSDPDRRARLKEEFDAGGAEAEEASAGSWSIAKVTVHSIPDDAPAELRRYEARTIGEIAAEERRHPIDVMLDLACVTDLRTEFDSAPLLDADKESLERMRQLVTYKYSLPGISDGGAHTKFFTLGSYTTLFLSEWVREHEMLDLEEAHWRLSAFPAQAAGIRDRGYLREGAPADILVYDFDKLALLPSERAYDFPAGEWRRTQKAVGYRWVIVNGEVTFEDSVPTGAVPGRLLRHGADAPVRA